MNDTIDLLLSLLFASMATIGAFAILIIGANSFVVALVVAMILGITGYYWMKGCIEIIERMVNYFDR